jgi:hypothetical protein
MYGTSTESKYSARHFVSNWLSVQGKACDWYGSCLQTDQPVTRSCEHRARVLESEAVRSLLMCGGSLADSQ